MKEIYKKQTRCEGAGETWNGIYDKQTCLFNTLNYDELIFSLH